jgi:hypothetical protein
MLYPAIQAQDYEEQALINPHTVAWNVAYLLSSYTHAAMHDMISHIVTPSPKIRGQILSHENLLGPMEGIASVCFMDRVDRSRW